MAELAAGDLLISSVILTGGVFDRSVIVLIDADDSGALGVIVNKINQTPLADVLPSWVELASTPRALFTGGPVSAEGAICLASLADPAEEPPGWRRVFGDIGLLHLDTPVELVEGAFRDLRIFAGYAGWGPGQLQAELARGSWHHAQAAYEDVFTPSPTDLWPAVLRRQPLPVSLFATWPVDPELN